MKFYFLLLVCFTSLFALLQAQQTTVIPHSFVGGNASVAYDKAWLPFHNPAALAAQQQAGVQLLYENRYITKELSNKAINFWIPNKYTSIGGSFSHFGYDQYHEMIVGLSLARQFSPKFRLGIEIDYYTVYLSPSERYASTITAQVGFQVMVTDQLLLAFNTFNPTFSRVDTELLNKRLPTLFSIGSRYRIREQVDWLIQIDKEIHSPLRWATGFEYVALDFLTIRLGAYGLQSFIPTLGAGIKMSDFFFDIQADYNNALGISFISSVRYNFRNR